MSHSASRKRASSLDALLYWESSRRPNRVPRTRRRMRAFARVAATPRVRVSLRSRIPCALFWQVCPIWRHRYSEPIEAISLMVSRTALLASPRKPKTKGVTVPNSYKRDSIGPTEPSGVLFHFLSAACAFLAYSLWTLLALVSCTYCILNGGVCYYSYLLYFNSSCDVISIYGLE